MTNRNSENNDKSKYREMTKDEFEKFIGQCFVDEENFAYEIKSVSKRYIRTTDGFKFTFKEMLNNAWLTNYEICGILL